MSVVEEAEQSAGPFGGLSAAEAGRRRWEKQKERDERGGLPIEGDREAVLSNMRKLAKTGTGTTAVQAARYLDEQAAKAKGAEESASILELLTPEQRGIVRSWLSQSASDGDTHTDSPA